MTHGFRIPPVLVALALLLPGGPNTALAQAARAVLFFSPTCPHCERVITRDLPGLFQAHGGSPTVFVEEDVPQSARTFILLSTSELEVLLVNTIRQEGGTLYYASLESHPTSEERLGVPRLVMGDTVLVGSFEIPTHFERLIVEASERGALDWPPIAGLENGLSRLAPLSAVAADATDSLEERQAPDTAAEAAPEEAPAAAAPHDTVAPRSPQPSAAEPSDDPDTVAASPAPVDSAARRLVEPAPAPDPAAAVAGVDSASREAGTNQATPFEAIARERGSVMERFRRDPVGNTLSVVVLLGMLAGLGVTLVTARRRAADTRLHAAVVPLAAIGIAVAGYLTYIEASGVAAVCGPVGDCNTVQQSEYATLFGAIPVGGLGMIGYVLMIGAWFVGRRGPPPVRDPARIALFALAFVGTVFSIYLTFLEPFVIGATCAWCLTSSVLVTILLWLSAGPAIAAWARVRGEEAPR